MWWARRRRPFVTRRLDALTGRTLPAPAPTIAVLVYRGVSTAEIDLPVSVLADRLGASVLFAGTEPGLLPGVEPSRDVVVDVLAAEAPLPDWLVVPGGLGWRRVIDDRATMAWLARAGAHARGILAISTGSLLLASAGLLDGLDATGHWLAIDDLERLGAHALRERIADAGRIMTASGALPATQVAAEFADKVSWSNSPWSCPA
jgi:putative intracellular protease/amidase